MYDDGKLFKVDKEIKNLEYQSEINIDESV